MKKLLTLLTAFAAASSPAIAGAGDVHLSAASIESLFPGYYQAEVFGGYTLLIAARANGRLVGRAFGREDRGRWMIVGDRLCVAWQRWTSGEDKCGRILRTDGWFVAYNDEEGQLLRFRTIAAAAFKQELASASGTDRN